MVVGLARLQQGRPLRRSIGADSMGQKRPVVIG